jgi:hypothetical protein
VNELHERIAASFKAQGLMATLGARLVSVADGEVHAFNGNESKVVAIMQATMVHVHG